MRLPLATYRLQFNSSFGFKEAKEIVPYLAKLGISDVYASPIFKARSGSLHGYDVVDHNLLNPDLGTAEEFEALSEALADRGMGWIQDIVPNHMSYSFENHMLSDVLERGGNSKYAQFFDIDWEHPSEGLKGKLQAPFLGDLYGRTLERGEIKLIYDQRSFAVTYYDLRLPLRLKSYAIILNQGIRDLEQRLGENDPDIISLKSIIMEADDEDREQNLKERLWDLKERSPVVANFLDSNLRLFNGEKEDSVSFDLLDDLLSQQFFRLCFWKVASDEINYRRFFIMNDMISLHTEKEEVFDSIHSLIFDLMETGKITGLRIDHLDGLYDPEEYLRRMKDRLKDRYLVAEKILLPGDAIPATWPIHGTTGYDFLNCQNGVLCDRARREDFEGIYSRFKGSSMPYRDVVYEKKKMIADRHMSGDVDNLARHIKNALGKNRQWSDITLSGIRKALTELLVFFPVYRTYASSRSFNEHDQNIIREASRSAKERNMDLFNELDFVEHFLLDPRDDAREDWQRMIMRFQQHTGPLMAKGVEDTTLYTFYQLLALNEVGGDPGSFGVSLDQFHLSNEEKARNWPHSMNATSTHDSKRGEDARARICVLSEIPGEWEVRLQSWSEVNEGLKKTVSVGEVPDRNDEYFLYQTMIGAFPFYSEDVHSFIERAGRYLVKAAREAKVHSGWVRPSASYEVAFVSFLKNIMASEEFRKDFEMFQRKVAHHGILNSLNQVLVKVTAPGIPDFYQGTELWDFSFVDPDNRRPVDFEKRSLYLDEIVKREDTDMNGLLEELLASKEDGRIKLFLIHKALKARQENRDLFAGGSYMRIGVEGTVAENIIAFARVHEGAWALTIAPRLTTTLTKNDEKLKGDLRQGDFPGWHIPGDVRLILPKNAPSSWRNAITDKMVRSEKAMPVYEILQHFPVALLIGREEE
jgi:(1->4)-alpha-D-glucan 1-alpha-D-glucosylmutase